MGSEMCIRDRVLVVKGKASHNHFSGDLRLSADELFDLEQARTQLARHMQIQLTADKIDQQSVHDLKRILSPSDEGLCSVGFDYCSASGTCQLDIANDWRVIPNKLMLDQLESIVGQSNIRVIY